MYSDLTLRRNIGLNFHPETGPEIIVWAPHARSLVLEVEGKADVALKKLNYGIWHASCPDVSPGDRYMLNINGKHSFPDPASLMQPTGVHEASSAIDLNEIRKIHMRQWKGITPRELIIYELHVGTFTPEGTFKALTHKLKYLKELGVTAIEIMPIATFPGGRNWGYDGVFPFAVQPTYGGPFEFAHLVRACHQQEIAVILDVVYNHLGPEGNYLNAFGPSFTSKYQTPWGDAINFDDIYSDGVRNYFLENAMMWLRDFHVDGLRLDAVHAIKDFSPEHFVQELSLNVQKLNEEVGANHFLISENDLNDTRFIRPIEKGGYGVAAQWVDEWHHALHALITGEKVGYYEDFGRLQDLVKSFNSAYVYDGVYSPHRKRIFGTSTDDLPGDKFVVFTQNHDQVGNRMKGERLSKMVDFETLKLAAGAMFASPYIPMLFMGEEYAEDSPFLYFISHSDQHLVEQVRKGRRREFREFIRNGGPPDPAAADTFKKSKLKWDFNKNGKKKQMLEYYKQLISLHRELPLMQPGRRENIRAREGIDGKTIVLTRKTGKEILVAVMNFSQDEVTEPLTGWDKAHPGLLINSASHKWGGPALDEEIPFSTDGKKLNVHLYPRSIIIFIV